MPWHNFVWFATVLFLTKKKNKNQVFPLLYLFSMILMEASSPSGLSQVFSPCSLFYMFMTRAATILLLQKHPLSLSLSLFIAYLSFSHHFLCCCRFMMGSSHDIAFARDSLCLVSLSFFLHVLCFAGLQRKKVSMRFSNIIGFVVPVR